MIYTIQKGDTLSSIAKRFTGNANNYKAIAASSGIVNPNVISVGQRVTIPDSLLIKAPVTASGGVDTSEQLLQRQGAFESGTYTVEDMAKPPVVTVNNIPQPPALPPGYQPSATDSQKVFGIPVKWLLIGAGALVIFALVKGKRR